MHRTLQALRTLLPALAVLALVLPSALAAPAAPKTPEFFLSMLDGRTVRSKDLRGKVVVLDFWATWCGPCVQALPELKSLDAQMKGEPFTLISISVDDRKEDVAAFVKRNGMTWKQAWDGTGQLAGNAFAVESFPTYVVLDHEGRQVFRQAGWAPRRSARALEDAVRKALVAARQAGSRSDVAR